MEIVYIPVSYTHLDVYKRQVNDHVVHGIPNDTPLKEGDIVSVDCGTYMNGFSGDSAYTFSVAEVDPEVLKLLKTTKEALYLGIENAIHGKRLGEMCIRDRK